MILLSVGKSQRFRGYLPRSRYIKPAKFNTTQLPTLSWFSSYFTDNSSVPFAVLFFPLTFPISNNCLFQDLVFTILQLLSGWSHQFYVFYYHLYNEIYPNLHLEPRFSPSNLQSHMKVPPRHFAWTSNRHHKFSNFIVPNLTSDLFTWTYSTSSHHYLLFMLPLLLQHSSI